MALPDGIGNLPLDVNSLVKKLIFKVVIDTMKVIVHFPVHFKLNKYEFDTYWYKEIEHIQIYCTKYLVSLEIEIDL